MGEISQSEFNKSRALRRSNQSLTQVILHILNQNRTFNFGEAISTEVILRRKKTKFNSGAKMSIYSRSSFPLWSVKKENKKFNLRTYLTVPKQKSQVIVRCWEERRFHPLGWENWVNSKFNGVSYSTYLTSGKMKSFYLKTRL